MIQTAETRTDEVSAKLARVRDWLDGSGGHAALFRTQPEVAWVTGGLEDRVVRNEEPGLVWALVTAGTAFAWNPTVRGAKSEDTFPGRRPARRTGCPHHRHWGLARHPARLTKGFPS